METGATAREIQLNIYFKKQKPPQKNRFYFNENKRKILGNRKRENTQHTKRRN